MLASRRASSNEAQAVGPPHVVLFAASEKTWPSARLEARVGESDLSNGDSRSSCDGALHSLAALVPENDIWTALSGIATISMLSR